METTPEVVADDTLDLEAALRKIERLHQEYRDLAARFTTSEREREHAKQRWDWWQKSATGIAEDRAAMFRAGEALRAFVDSKTFGCTEVAVWDAAAQPMRDMIAAMTPSTKA